MKNKEIVKEMVMYLGGSVFVSVFGFILSVLYSNMFDPNDYGIYSLVYSAYNLIAQLYSGWIVLSLIRNYESYKKKNEEESLAATLFQLQLILSIILILVSFLAICILEISNIAKEIFIILVISYFFEQSILILNTILRAEQKSKQYNINTMVLSLLKIISILVLYYIVGYKNIKVISISLLLAQVLQYIFLYRKVNLKKYYSKKLFKKEIIKSMFKYGYPLVGISVTSWILNVSDRYIIKFFCTNSEVGLYSYAYSLGNNLFSVLTQFIMLGAYSNIVKAWENDGPVATKYVIRKYLKIYFWVLIPACVGISMISRDFFEAFTNPIYQESYNVFTITCLSITILGITQYTNKYWELTKNTKILLTLNVLIAIINVILNFILIPVYGYEIAAITTLISYVIYLGISIVAARKIISIDIKSLFKVFVSSMMMVLMISLFNFISGDMSSILKMVIKIVIGIFIYVICMILFKEINITLIINKCKEIFRKKVKI